MIRKEYEEALKRGVRKFLVAGTVASGLLSPQFLYGQWYAFRGIKIPRPVEEPVQSFSRLYQNPSYLQSSSGSITRALWQAERDARRSLSQAVGHHQLKLLEGHEDPKEVRRLAREKTLSIQDVVNAFKELFTAGERTRTLTSVQTEANTERSERKTPSDELPWRRSIPVSPYSPLCGFCADY